MQLCKNLPQNYRLIMIAIVVVMMTDCLMEQVRAKEAEREEPKYFLCNFRKGFLINRTSRDGRKKLHDDIDNLSDSSAESEIEELNKDF